VLYPVLTGNNHANKLLGIGKETAKVIVLYMGPWFNLTELRQSLLVHNARVYIAARDEGKADLAIKDLKDQTGKDPFFLRLDLADLHSVKAAAKEFAR
jgi:hypothetical protein